MPGADQSNWGVSHAAFSRKAGNSYVTVRASANLLPALASPGEGPSDLRLSSTRFFELYVLSTKNDRPRLMMDPPVLRIAY